MRGKCILAHFWRGLFTVGAILIPLFLINYFVKNIPPVKQPLIVSLAGAHFGSTSLYADNQALANATIQAVALHSTNSAMDNALLIRENELTQDFTSLLPSAPVVPGFFHQLRLIPHINYIANNLVSATLGIDEFHPSSGVTIRYESWIARGETVEQPLLTKPLARQFARVLHVSEKDLKRQVGKPLAMGLLPNYKVRLYADGALSKYIKAPVYRDISLAQLPSLAEEYHDDFYSTYPARASLDVQTSLDREYQAALKRNVAAPNCAVESCVALTFDDGPDPANTPRILDILNSHGINATFFELGSQVQRSPDLTKQLIAAGNEVESHTFNHPDLVKLKIPSLIRKQIDDTQSVFNSVGLHAKFLRPPYGSIDNNVRAVANMPLILWNVDSQEWRTGTTPASMSASIVSQARPGAIILMHDTQKITGDALPEVLAQLEARNFRFITVQQLLQLNDDDRGIFASR